MTVAISFEGADQQECIGKMQDFLRTYYGEGGPKQAEKAEEKPKARTRTKPAEPQAEADPDAGEDKPAPKGKRGKKIDFDDITEAAGRLVKACDNDMKRAQELVYSEFGVRKVSKLAVEDYPKAHRWMLKISEQMEAKQAKGEDEEE
jgi:hypothetical protein